MGILSDWVGLIEWMQLGCCGTQLTRKGRISEDHGEIYGD